MNQITIKKIPSAMIRALLAGTAAVLAASIAASAEPSWHLLQEENDLSIYSRPVDGSSYNEIKGTVLINAPIDRVSKFIGDGNGCAQWRMKCKSSQVIETVSQHERYVHTVLDLPWPAADRDFVLHSRTKVDTHTRTAIVSLNSSPLRIPKGDFVRAETNGQLMIRAINDQLVEFTYIMHTELGGSLPVGRVNSELAHGAYEDLSRLRELAEG